MFLICKSIEIENGHMLAKHPDKCRFPHGHTRKVEFVLEADDLDDREMVCDFKIIKETIGQKLDAFDHALCMNTADPMFPKLKEAYGDRVIGFEKQDPTTEILARHFYQLLDQELAAYAQSPADSKRYPLRPSVRIHRVRVWETSSSWAEYHP